MYESRAFHKLKTRVGSLGALIGALVFFVITYFALYPIIAFYNGDPDFQPAGSSKVVGLRRVVDKSGNAKTVSRSASGGGVKGFTMVINRGTVSTFAGLAGALIGLLVGNEVARGMHKKKELQALVERGRISK